VTVPLRVLIVDAQRMFREGIRSRLEQEPDIRVVGEASSAEEAQALAKECNPSIIVSEIRLPGMSGIELVRLLRTQQPGLKVLILSAYDSDLYVREAARVGIDGYLLKDASQEALVEALREIAAGRAALPSYVVSKLMSNYSSGRRGGRVGRSSKLTLREMEVLELVCQGRRNTEIASRLSISRRTVEAYLSTLMAKLGVQSRTEAMIQAMRSGMIEDGAPKT